MNLLGTDLKQYIIDNITKATSNNIKVGTMPSNPVECFIIYHTGGYPPQNDMTADPTIQITIRHGKYSKCQENAMLIHNLLKEKYTFFLSTNIWIVKIEALGEPQQIGTDENGNYLFTSNYHLWLQYIL
jgi:hypothetical protein